jgi:hypothetical protein
MVWRNPAGLQDPPDLIYGIYFAEKSFRAASVDNGRKSWKSEWLKYRGNASESEDHSLAERKLWTTN